MKSLAVLLALAQLVGSGRNWSATGRDSRNGMQSVMYCGNSPESYVRGSATVDTASGSVAVAIQLETDSVAAGPKGRVVVTVKNRLGASIATIQSEEVGIGGKAPGKARIENFSSRLSIDTALAAQADSVYVEAECKGSVDRLFNIKLGTVEDAFKLLLLIPQVP